MYSQNEIDEFVKEKTGIDTTKPTDDLFSDHGVVGDDFHELIDEYAKTFSVDMTGYLWYFHTDEEGTNIGGEFFRPPYARVKRIPITPAMLHEFANQGGWNLTYPAHKLPKRRWDIIFNQILVSIVIAFMLYSCLT